MHFRKKRSCFVVVVIGAFAIWLYCALRKPDNRDENPESLPDVVWWTTQFAGYSHKISKCEHGYDCHFYGDRRARDDAVGFLFYGSDFDPLDLPLPRNGGRIIWGLFHEESPRNTPVLGHEPTLSLFNYSSTVSRYSHAPLTLQHLEGIGDILDQTYYVDTKTKNELLAKISPVLYVQSDCSTSSYRDEYVKELMKYVSIDSYGACLNNKNLSKQFRVDYLNNLNADEFLRFVSRYKFTIAIENGICDDYITEKLWRPLKVGSVPIYMGSPSIKDWLPNEKSAIIVSEFKSPKHLAEHIHFLNDNNGEYERYLQHKISRDFNNEKLKNAAQMISRSRMETSMETFECFVCFQIHENLKESIRKPSVLNISHYRCQTPDPPWKEIQPNFWLDVWDTAKKESEVLYEFVIKKNRRSFTKDEFEKRIFSI